MGYGLNFQTNTIINSTDLFEGLSEKGLIKIKYDFNFATDCIKAVRKAEGHDYTACKATIDFTNLVSATENLYYRLDVYLGVEGADPAIYANDSVTKGIPFWIEFVAKKGETAANLAQKLYNLLNKNNVFFIGEKLINVTQSGAVVTLEGATEYQRFRKIELYKYDAAGAGSEKVTDAVENSQIKITVKGKNGFGTYSQLIKDLRLPTAANTNWTRLRKDDAPIVGEIYNQYIIEYQAPANNNSMQAVGGKLDSTTVHVFWVKEDIASDFEDELTTVAGISFASINGEDQATAEGNNLDS